MLVILILQKSS